MLRTLFPTVADTSPPGGQDAAVDHPLATTTVMGSKVRYLLKPGDAAAPPLLICNGLGQSIEILYPLIDELPDRTIIAFDAPGLGRSEVNGKVRTIPDFAACAMALIDQLGIDEFDVLGISWGGSLAQQMAYDAPERVKKLVLAITSAGGIGSWWGTPIALSEIMFPMRYADKAYGNFIGPWMYGGNVILNPGSFREYSKHAIAPTPEGYFTQVRAMCGWTSLPWLRRLRQPTLVLAGQYDGLIPLGNQLLLSNLIPDAQLHVFQDGHLLMYSRRHEVATLISSFLD